MTITSVTEMWSRQTGSKASEDGLSFTVSYRAAYEVVHTVGTTIPEILNASDGANSVPRLGDLYLGTAGGVFCTDVGDVERVGQILSIVPVAFSGEVASQDDNDPLNKDPEIEYGAVTVTEAIDEDIDGRPFTNVNGEPVQGLTDEIWDYELRVKRNFASWDTYALRQYARSYNSDTFFGWPPGTASLGPPRIKPVKYGSSQEYFEVTAAVRFREPYNTIPLRAWWKRYRNEGLYNRVGTIVTFSGGGGSGATGYPIVSSAGVVTAVAVTNQGGEYTTAPTVSISGEGSGATATATINSNGLVTGVSVGAGGTGYKSKLIRAVDEQNDPVTKPVLLAADGSREFNADNALWLERPTKRPLPYNALGLL